MPQGKGTYGNKRGRPPKKNSATKAIGMTNSARTNKKPVNKKAKPLINYKKK